MSSAVIGALRADLGLDSARFSRGVSDAQKSLATLRTRFLAVGGAALAFGTALGTAALRGADNIDKAVKSARRIDATLGGFRALEIAAGEAGVPIDQIASSIQTMNRELAKGGKGPDKSLASIGLAAKDLVGIPAEEKLAKIADGIKRAGMDAGQASAVLQGLGIRSKEMVLAMVAGGDVFRNAAADVKSYGLALTTVQTDSIEKANDAIGRLSLIGTYLGDQLALKIVPALGAFAQAMTDSLREGGLLRTVIDGFVGNLDRLSTYIGVAVVGFGTHYVAALVAARLATMTFAGSLAFLRGALIRTGIGALVVLAGELVFQFAKLVDRAGGFGKALALLGGVAKGVWRGIIDSAGAIPVALDGVWDAMRGGFLISLSRMTTAFQDFIWNISNAMRSAGFTEMADSLQSVWDGADAVGGALSKAGNDLKDGAAAKFAEAGGIIANAFQPAKDAVSALNDVVAETGTAATDASGGVDDLGNSLDNLGGGGGGGKGKTDKAKEALAALREELTRVRDTMGMTDTQAKIYNATRDAGVAATSAEGVEMAKIIPEIDRLTAAKERLKATAESVKTSLSDVFTGVLSGAMSLKEGISQLLNSLAKMWLDNAFQALWNGGGARAGGGFLSGLGKLLGFANGTNYAPGGLARVNERGGEIINLPRGSQVIPHDISKRMAGDGGVTRVVVELGSGLIGQVVDEARGNTVEIVQATFAEYDRNLGLRVAQVSGDPRRKG